MINIIKVVIAESESNKLFGKLKHFVSLKKYKVSESKLQLKNVKPTLKIGMYIV